MENGVDYKHQNDIGPEIILIKVITIQHLGTVCDAGQFRLCCFTGCYTYNRFIRDHNKNI